MIGKAVRVYLAIAFLGLCPDHAYAEQDHVPPEIRKKSPYVACAVDMSWKYASSKQTIESIVSQARSECEKYIAENIDNSFNSSLPETPEKYKNDPTYAKMLLRSTEMHLRAGFDQYVRDQINGMRKIAAERKGGHAPNH